MIPIPTTTTKAIVSDVKANQFESSARTIAAEITAIAAAASFDPNFKPTAGVSRPAGESSRARMRSANASSVARRAAEYATAHPRAPQRFTGFAAAASAAIVTKAKASTLSIVGAGSRGVYGREGASRCTRGRESRGSTTSSTIDSMKWSVTLPVKRNSWRSMACPTSSTRGGNPW